MDLIPFSWNQCLQSRYWVLCRFDTRLVHYATVPYQHLASRSVLECADSPFWSLHLFLVVTIILRFRDFENVI